MTDTASGAVPAPPTTPEQALPRIRAAAETIGPHALRTPVVESPALSQELGRRVSLKLETLQRTGAFKVRGALNKILRLPDDERARGVVAASAGNHAQGVGLAAQITGARATIVMPRRTPDIKVRRTAAYGAEVVLHGENYDEAYEHARALADDSGRTMIHPFDDLEVIEGQGTIGLELDDQCGALDTLVVPIGGGGLIAGIALAIKALRPSVRVVGVQAAGADPMVRSFHAGREERVPHPSTIADGIQVGKVGRLTWPLVRAFVDECVIVTEEELAHAIVWLLEQQKLVAEGAGAAAVAALLARKVPGADDDVCALVCGGNIDLRLLARVIDAGLVGAGRYRRLVLRARDVPGTLERIAHVFGEQSANIADIVHHRAGWRVPVGFVDVEVLAEVRDESAGDALAQALRVAGFELVA